VASKQLVQDLVLTSPATFLSFQQILCPLPTLDIHSNKERHRFDLRDNTDQTRCSATLIKKKIKLSSYMRKLRRERSQSHI
jgi:hypothetical protein